MINNVQKLITAVSLGDKQEMGKAFASIMQEKVRNAIDVKNIEVAEKIYNENEELSIDEAKSMDINRTIRMIDELEGSLKRGSKLNKDVNKALGGNYDKDFKTMQNSMDDIYDIWSDIEAELDMNESSINDIYKSEAINRTIRMIDELEGSLKRGSKLNREVNKALGGNYDKDFKTMQNSMDNIYDIWSDIEAELV